MEDETLSAERFDAAEPSREAVRVARGFVYGLGISVIFWVVLLAAIFVA